MPRYTLVFLPNILESGAARCLSQCSCPRKSIHKRLRCRIILRMQTIFLDRWSTLSECHYKLLQMSCIG